MIVPDINLLVSAYDESSPYHKRAKEWLSLLLDGREEVGFPLVSLLGFIRLSSNPKLFENPFAPSEACEHAASWLSTPSAAILHPGSDHLRILQGLLKHSHASSSLTTDAHLAAIAIEHHAVIHSNDDDFRRFRGVRYFNPLVE